LLFDAGNCRFRVAVRPAVELERNTDVSESFVWESYVRRVLMISGGKNKQTTHYKRPVFDFIPRLKRGGILL